MTVLFVGDQPSKKNSHPSVAFHGTKSYDTLMNWAHKHLKLPLYEITMVNSVTCDDWMTIAFHDGAKNPIIALGNKAHDRLAKHGIHFFSLPHPSGRNRKLNNKEYIDSELQKCYLWLEDQRNVQNMRRIQIGEN